MVTPEELAAFDLLLWLRTGHAASRYLHCNQSTISRQARRVADTFQISTHRLAHEWATAGNTTLLRLEREVHQLKRLILGQGLRLEAGSWPGRTLAMPMPPGWLAGTLDHIGIQQPLALLGERIIDAWLTLHTADIPSGAGALWAAFPICSMPWQLMADQGHPLVGERGITLADLERFPGPAITNNKRPALERALKNTGLKHEQIDPCHQYRDADWCGRTKDKKSLCYGIELVQLLDTKLQPLDFQLNAQAELALVVRQDIAEHTAIDQLIHALRQRAMDLRSNLSTLELT
jgi:hypothetical protein